MSRSAIKNCSMSVHLDSEGIVSAAKRRSCADCITKAGHLQRAARFSFDEKGACRCLVNARPSSRTRAASTRAWRLASCSARRSSPQNTARISTCAASVALSYGCREIFYGAHSDDAAGNAYPDCSQDFNDSINRAIYLGSGKQLRVTAPFIGMNKAQVVKRGLALKVPYELTWSCYSGLDKPCGVCGTCRDRAAAFEANGVTDPLMKRN